MNKFQGKRLQTTARNTSMLSAASWCYGHMHSAAYFYSNFLFNVYRRYLSSVTFLTFLIFWMFLHLWLYQPNYSLPSRISAHVTSPTIMHSEHRLAVNDRRSQRGVSRPLGRNIKEICWVYGLTCRCAHCASKIH